MENKSYYAVIPATVRYDERLKLLSRMLYGEITALSNEKGYCWANNKYFATLYKVSIRTITDCIKQLIDCGYITSQIIYKENSKEVEQRILKLANTPRRNFQEGIEEKQYTPLEENFQDNITSINNTFNIRETNKSKEIVPPDYEEAKKYYQEKQYDFGFDNWFYYYESKGWMIGKNKVKSWKATMKTWSLNRKKDTSFQSNPAKEEFKIGYKSYEELVKEQEENQIKIKEMYGC